MITRDDIVEVLDGAGIAWSSVEHPPAETTAAADGYIEGHAGVRTKSLFIVNRKRTRSYLLVMDDAKALDLVSLAAVLDETRLSLGSPERLKDALDVDPGVVSPFCLLDPDHRTPQLLWDEEMLRDPVLTFHPGRNTETIFVGTQDLRELLAAAGVDERVVSVAS